MTQLALGQRKLEKLFAGVVRRMNPRTVDTGIFGDLTGELV